MNIVKLEPATKDYIWGGTVFSTWGKVAPNQKVAECWELSFHKDGLTKIASGKNKGENLADVATKEDIGVNSDKFTFFPILVKLIDAHDNLSVQVHPSDDYALKYENSFGKTEMWYVLDAVNNGGLYVGFKKDETLQNVENAIKDNTIMDMLNFYPVKKGDCFMIPSGTLHAIGKGVTIVEIQQNSNLTYRVYDYNRKGADGKTRPLHIEKALKVLNLKKYTPTTKEILEDKNLLAKSQYFTVYECESEKVKELYNENTFMCVTFISGTGTIKDNEETLTYKKGDSFFIPCKNKALIEGNGEFILSQVD